jgi:predicted TIM-barrel fold metal-dependent hydrolase
MKSFRVIDADGHVIEADADLAEYVVYRGRPMAGLEFLGKLPLFPSLDGWFRPASDAASPGHLAAWQSFLDETGIERSVLYPSTALGQGLIQDAEWSVALARGYNDWLYDRYLRLDQRLHAVAVLPVHDVAASVAELRRTVAERGFRGGVLPSITVLNKGYGNRDFDPLYAEAERLDVPLAIHGGTSKGIGIDFFDKFIKTHTLEHPIPLMIQLTDMTFEAVFERFPRLRVAFLESGCGWVPYMMDRLDEEFERRGQRWCPELTKPPSEYLRGGNVYVTCEVEEKSVPYVAERLGEDQIMFPSDYPHERLREQFLHDIPALVERVDLSDMLKEKILFHNAERFYRLG